MSAVAAPAMLHCTATCTAQHSAAQHQHWQHITEHSRTAQLTAHDRTAQHKIAQNSTEHHNIAQHSTIKHNTAQNRIEQLSASQHSTKQHSTTEQMSACPVQPAGHYPDQDQTSGGGGGGGIVTSLPVMYVTHCFGLTAGVSRLSTLHRRACSA